MTGRASSPSRRRSIWNYSDGIIRAAVLAMVALSLTHDSVVLVVVLLAILAAARYSGLTVFYSIPSIYLSGRTAATGIAVATSMGSFAGAGWGPSKSR